MHSEIKANFKSGTHGEMWEMLQEANLSLISQDESSDCDVTAAVAVAFLADDADVAQTQAVGGDEDGDSDEDCGI